MHSMTAFLALLIVLALGACSAVESVFGRRLDYRAAETAAILKGYRGDCPLVLYNIVGEREREEFCSALVDRLGDQKVVYDVRDSQPDGATGEVSSYETTFQEYLKTLPDNSDHYSSMYLMDERVLDSLDSPLKILMDATVRPHGVGGDDNLFDYFPEELRPKKALVVGGLGSRSFLHSDPYSWIGTNYLYEGRKLWTFLPPNAAPAEMRARAKPVDAFGIPIAAGRVSEIDLYHRITDSTSECALNRRWSAQHRNYSEQNDDIPLFGGSHLLSDAAVVNAQQIIQEEGDLIIIPQLWWHQVYHLQPSIAIAFQYFDNSIKLDVLSHVLEFCGYGPAAYKQLPPAYASLSDRDQVKRIIELAVRLARNRE